MEKHKYLKENMVDISMNKFSEKEMEWNGEIL